MIRSIIITGVVTNLAIFGYGYFRGETLPPPPPVQESYHAKALTFAERWEPVSKLWAFERSDRLLPGERLIAPPLTVKTERIIPPPQQAAVEEPPPVRKVAGDPCTKHNMRKQMISKYKWRCVK